MLELFLLPGDRVCDMARLDAGSPHRQILRMFVNTLVWSAVAVGAAVWLSL
jgi:hypothetical protein